MQHPKGILIERSKQLGLGKPSFSTHNTGPEHEPLFQSEVKIRGVVYGRGEGSTKRDAERRASETALEALGTSRTDGPVGRTEAAPAPEVYPDEAFNGPWPIFAEVLAASLHVAHARVNPTLTGPDAVSEVQALALQLYKGTLEHLGEVVDLDDLGKDPVSA